MRPMFCTSMEMGWEPGNPVLQSHHTKRGQSKDHSHHSTITSTHQSELWPPNLRKYLVVLSSMLQLQSLIESQFGTQVLELSLEDARYLLSSGLDTNLRYTILEFVCS